MNRRQKNEKKKRKKWPFVVGGVFGFIALFFATGFIYVNSMLNKIEKVDIDESKLGIDSTISNKYSKIENIALFGVDATDGHTGRSDSIMILTIDREHKKAKVTSLMRDSYVNIDGHGKTKLNHAYAYGGPELAIKTINETFGLNIKDFITVNFSSLPKIIDTIGGIDLDIRADELKYINQYINDLNKKNNTSVQSIASAGKQHVNGTQAMAYCRIRYTAGGDYERTERHRTVLEQIFEKMQSVSITKYPTILNDVLPLVRTSLSSNEILSLGGELTSIGGKLEQERFPKDKFSKGAMINGTWYLTFEEGATKTQVQDWIFEDKK